MLTFWNTAHGPQKSMITAPSETRNATGILPWVGGLSEFETALGFSEGMASDNCIVRVLDSVRGIETGIAAMKLNAADLWSNSLRFIASLLCDFQVFQKCN